MQNKECADQTNTALLAEVSPENGQEVYAEEEKNHEETNSEPSKGIYIDKLKTSNIH